MRVAAIDIGTNSTRLLVADVGTDADAPRRFRRAAHAHHPPRSRCPRVARSSTRTRSSAPLPRCASTATRIDATGAERVRMTATSASRDATNRDVFFDAAEAVIGVRPELISGEEEGALTFTGATAGLDQPGPYLVFDVGGGSTELIVGTDRPDGLLSVDIGCVRLTEAYLHGDPPTAEELSQAVSVVRDHLLDVSRELPAAAGAKTLIGCAGTVWTMAAIELGVDASESERIHHFRLTRAAAEDVFRTLATEPVAQRRHNPGLEPGRVDVIVGGAIVVVSVMRHFHFDELLVSEADILDGLARSLAG